MSDVEIPSDGGAGAGVRPAGSVRVLYAVAIALGAVILAPIALSSQDLYRWALAPQGLGLAAGWAPLVPVALDLAAAACIGMTVVASWRRDRPGVFGLLVWVFALTSAYAQYTHGVAEKTAGRAQDAWWAMPAFAILGPLLLEVTLHRLRRWARQDAAEILTGAAGFGVRWLVAPWSTLSAWATSRREGIAQAGQALAYIRDRKTVKALNATEAVLYAIGATGSTDPHTARVWLAERGVRVGQVALDTAVAAHRDRVAAAGTAGSSNRLVPPSAPDVPGVDVAGADVASVDVANVAAAASRVSRSRAGEPKRQPSAGERIAQAVARTPNASDVVIASRLGLSEATVRRHRRQFDVSVTSPAAPKRRQAVDSVSTQAAVTEAPAGGVADPQDTLTDFDLAAV